MLKMYWADFLPLNLLTACHPINSPDVKAKAWLALAEIPSTNIRECHVWKYIYINYIYWEKHL